ncbi:hypothetical protein AHF37_12079 [Paragonimus kellicotti]|nr:hypothetical protein AHF37_12079 [Paragonimus kellicotti]
MATHGKLPFNLMPCNTVTTTSRSYVKKTCIVRKLATEQPKAGTIIYATHHLNLIVEIYSTKK